MTVDTYVLLGERLDRIVLKNGSIMTMPEVVFELNHMAVQAAQHERIVGELRTEIAMLRSYESEWELLLNQHEQERDAALARVAKLETALTPFAAVADAYDDSEDDDHEPYTDMGCDDRLCLTLGQHRAARTALSGAPAQAQHSVSQEVPPCAEH